MAQAGSAEQTVREIRRRTGRRFSAEEQIRIVLEGLRGEESIAALSAGERWPRMALVHESGVRHLQRHVKEFEERHNARMADTLEQVELTMRRMIGRRLRYQDLVKGNGLKSGARAVAA